MKYSALLLSLFLTSQVMASEVFQKPIEDGMDRAILDSFNQLVGKEVIDDISSVSIDDIKHAVGSVRLKDEYFEITFDDTKVRELLNSRGIATWSGLDSPVLVWLASVDENSISVLNGDSEDPVVTALKEASAKNNYNLMFPVMDLDDVSQVNGQTILSHSDKILAEASKRYDAEFFVAGAVDSSPETDEYMIKWNVYSADGTLLGSGQNFGLAQDSCTQMSRQVARVLMNNIVKEGNKDLKTSAGEAESITDTQSDGSIALGPVQGGVRILVSGIDNISDYPKITRILISYGYEADITVLGYSADGVIFLIPTGSAPSILDGTLSHAGEFSKIGDWTYRFNRSAGQLNSDPSLGTVTTTTSRVKTSLKDYDGKAYSKETVKKTVEVTTQNVIKEKGDSVPVIYLTDDSSENSTQSLGIEITE
ncbi:MAG: DUF2066 domain-containing protein [Succinivibrio sp.]